MDIDDPRTTEIRRDIIKSKPFVHRIYNEWYRKIQAHLPKKIGCTLELGSGGGFLRDYIPGVVTSEIFICKDISVVLDGCALPFRDNSLRAIVLVDVLHHIPNVRRFLAEANRCLVPNGRILMIEPWVSRWSRLIYSHLHHEPFLPGAATWDFTTEGPLSGANGALPWIVFERDREQFEAEFPALRIVCVEPWMPFRYLVSGGISMRTLMPAFTHSLWRMAESCLGRWSRTWPMFAFIVVERTGV
jgi:SAM-dependent methyltransferase